jgi:tRNA threonylcarbamoyladenosine biosynthesis protein TsaE
VGEVVTISTAGSGDTGEAGRLLGLLLGAGDVVVLSGDLGAGKTRLTQGVGEGLGVTGNIVSPTFNILLVHEGGTVPLYHFDLYRLTRAVDLDDIDFFGTLEAGGASIIEWGDRFPEALPDDHLDVTMAIDGPDGRVLTITGAGPRGRSLARQWADAWEARRT